MHEFQGYALDKVFAYDFFSNVESNYSRFIVVERIFVKFC